MSERIDLYPPIECNHSGILTLDELHKMYWEESGNPDGIPVVFLHGGPGAGCMPIYRRFFDPETFRIILFDQRGAGRSQPTAETRNNTTQHLVADMERLRQHLGIDRWLLFGGSWGSTLALVYGETHPERCLGFVLRGIFLGSRREIDWFLYCMGTFFPEAWRAFLAPIAPDERLDILKAYHGRLISEDPAVNLPAARAWGRYESACSTLRHNPVNVSAMTGDRAVLALARLEAHYFINDLFLAENQILDGLHRIRHLPATLIHGRYDVICPIVTADELARAWPEAEYVIVGDAGHSAMEPGIRSALVAATESIKRQIESVTV